MATSKSTTRKADGTQATHKGEKTTLLLAIREHRVSGLTPRYVPLELRKENSTEHSPPTAGQLELHGVPRDILCARTQVRTWPAYASERVAKVP